MDKRQRKQAESNLSWGAALALFGVSYYLYGTDEGAKKRAKFYNSVAKTREGAIDVVEKLTKVDEKTYRKVVGDILLKYRKIKSVDPNEVRGLAKDIRKHWNKIEKKMNKVK